LVDSDLVNLGGHFSVAARRQTIGKFLDLLLFLGGKLSFEVDTSILYSSVVQAFGCVAVLFFKNSSENVIQ
jgi:hypothetical protein